MNLLYGPGAGALFALGSAATWAVIGLLARTLSPILNSVAINALRVSGGAALLLAWVLLAGGFEALADLSLGNLGLLTLSAVLGFGLGDTSFFASTRSLGLARATTVSVTYPLIAALLARAFLGEPITPRAALGALLTLSGLALIITSRSEDAPAGEGFWRGLGAATLASLAWAVTAILLKPPLQEIDAITAQVIRLPLAGAVLWVTPWTRGAIRQIMASGPATLWWVAGLSLLTAATSVMFVAGLKYAGVAAGTVLSSTSPLFAIPLGVFVLGERLAPRAVFGSIVTVAGIAVLQL